MDEDVEGPAGSLLRDIIATLREPVATGDDAVAAAMAQLRREAVQARWLRRGGLAAGLAAALLLVADAIHQTAGRADGVTFALAVPAASRVTLIGDFNDWDPSANPLRQHQSRWSVTLKLKPGRYRYSFVVDGSSWQADPGRPPADDDFGTPTSVITVVN